MSTKKTVSVYVMQEMNIINYRKCSNDIIQIKWYTYNYNTKEWKKGESTKLLNATSHIWFPKVDSSQSRIPITWSYRINKVKLLASSYKYQNSSTPSAYQLQGAFISFPNLKLIAAWCRYLGANYNIKRHIKKMVLSMEWNATNLVH